MDLSSLVQQMHQIVVIITTVTVLVKLMRLKEGGLVLDRLLPLSLIACAWGMAGS